MSEAYLHWLFPAMRSAYGAEWIQTLKNAETIDAVWYVPGHGFDVDDAKTLKADLPAYRHALEQVVADATRLPETKVACEAPQRGGGAAAAVAGAPAGGRGATAAAGGAPGGAAQQRRPPARRGSALRQLGRSQELDALFEREVETAVRRVYDELDDGKLLPGGFGATP